MDIASDVNDNCNIDMVADKQPQFLDCYPEAVAHCALSLLVVNQSTTNRDSAQQAVQQTKSNNVNMAAACQPNYNNS